jgi:hypothetical protein
MDMGGGSGIGHRTLFVLGAALLLLAAPACSTTTADARATVGRRLPSTAPATSEPAAEPSTTSTTEAPAGRPPNPEPPVAAAMLPRTGPAVAAPVTPAAAPAVTTDCADALAHLAAHQAPGFTARCGPGIALGHYGFTCWNRAPHCPDGGRVIHIACPAPFVYMNEAHNSWALTGSRTGIDPYGQGTAAEQAYCNRLR